jgi:hypothetical protein
MTPELKSRIQIFLVVLLVLAAGRVAYIFHERNSAANTRKAEDESRALTSDEYVVPKKFYAHDLASAKALVGKPVWVKQGYGNLVYPVPNSAPDLNRGTASLLPLERLQVKDVTLRSAPASWNAPSGESELLAICARPQGSSVAVPIGSARNGEFHLQVNDIFYIQDPHQLYAHWGENTWKSIDAHQAKPGMNELQVNFALGAPQSAGGGDYGDRTLVYSNGGSPVSVSFSNDKATEITPVRK